MWYPRPINPVFAVLWLFPVLAFAANPDPAPTPTPVPAAEVTLTVAADPSLRGVMAELTQAWADSENHDRVGLEIAGPAAQRESLKPGGGWDVIITALPADLKTWIDQGKVQADTQKNVARAELAVLGRKPLVSDDDPEWFDLATQEWEGLAVGDPGLTASGNVARAALEKHGLIAKLEGHLRLTSSEMQAIDTVLRQEADAALILKSDLISVKLPAYSIFPVNPDDYPPLLYTAVVVAGTKKGADSRAFIAFLVSEPARPIWRKWGFGV